MSEVNKMKTLTMTLNTEQINSLALSSNLRITTHIDSSINEPDVEGNKWFKNKLYKLVTKSYKKENRRVYNALNKRKLHMEIIFKEAKSMYPAIKNYCFTKSLDNLKQKVHSLEATSVMNDERINRFSIEKTPTQYFNSMMKKLPMTRKKKAPITTQCN